MRLFALGMGLSVCLAAHANDDCSPVDLRADLGAPRAQDGTSWCYAHSAADLLSQAMHRRVSSIDLAATYLMGNEALLHKIKHPAMQEYLKQHPDFDSRLKESRKEKDAYTPDKILSAGGIVDTGGRDDEAIVLSNLKGLCKAELLPAGKKNVEKYLRAIRDDLVDDDEVEPIVEGPIGAVENDFARIMAHAFQKWVDERCGERLKPKAPLLPHEVSVAESLEEYIALVKTGLLNGDEARVRLVKELDRVLDSGKVAAIAYESFDLYPRTEPVRTERFHGDHSSVVAARKKIEGECHYFVRNHFGATCGYRREYEENCEKGAGGVWVKPEALKHLYSVISVR
jgi:hypothetical protein